MRSTIDRAGRIVVPKPISEAANLRPGTEVEFRVQGGHVEIEPVPLAVTLQPRGSLVVAVPAPGQPVMRAADVDKTVAELREPRPEPGPTPPDLADGSRGQEPIHGAGTR